MGRLAGKIALVTGAAAPQGIGAGCVARLAEEGAVVFGADVDEQTGRQTMADLAGRGLQASFVALDVTRDDQWRSVVDGIVERHGRLDVLVNNAGIAFASSVEDTTLERFRRLNQINLIGTYLGLQHGVRVMRAGRPSGGSIINLSSVAGHIGLMHYSAYCASKGGVKNLTRAAALECRAAGDGVRINSVHPGLIWTAMNQVNFDDRAAAEAGARASTPLGLLGEPLDIANGVVFLASDDSVGMTGAALTIDGGMTAD